MDDNHPLNRRILTKALKTARTDTPVILLHGARQTGKTTLMQQLAANDRAVRYATLDDAVVLAAAQGDPAAFLKGFPGPVVIDEVQRAPELFPAIKAEVDRNRIPGRFLLTGSANIFLVPRISESLAGRMEVLTLWPFSQGEMAGAGDRFIDAVFGNSVPPPLPDLTDLGLRILRGGYPPAVAREDPDRRRAWFASYITTILERDVRDLGQIESLSALPRLLSLIAARIASLLNFAEMSRGLSIPQTTLKRYFSLLEAIFLVQLLPAWSTNLGKRLVKAPKLLLNDTGLAAHLLGANEDRLTQDPMLRGALLENFVAMELYKQAGCSATRPQLFHFRTASGQEVDFVIEDSSGRICGVEVKSSATITGHDFNGLRALSEMAGNRFHRGVVLYTGASSVPFGPNLYAMPANALWEWRDI